MYSPALNESGKTPAGDKKIPVKIRVGASEIEGKGLFAAAGIHEGETLFLISGKFISHAYSPEFATKGPDWIGATANKWLAPDEDNLIVYLNHGCTPNCYINEAFEVVAARSVAKGEELIIDYSTTEIDPFWVMDCSCKSADCRKKIKAFQCLPRTLQLKYLRYIPMRLFKSMPKA